MELNRDQIVKAVAELRKRGLSNGGSIGYHAGWCDEVADLLENALALIRELTEENERVKTDTVVKMQERLKAESEYVGECTVDNPLAEQYSVVREEVIDQIAKEMLEGGEDHETAHSD